MIFKDTYHGDPYIKQVASKMTPCFGILFEHQDEFCQSCPLGLSCQQEFYRNIELVDKPTTVSSPTSPSTASAPRNIGDMLSFGQDTEAREFACGVDTTCVVCMGEIPTGEIAKYKLKLGFWHKHCHKKYLKKA